MRKIVSHQGGAMALRCGSEVPWGATHHKMWVNGVARRKPDVGARVGPEHPQLADIEAKPQAPINGRDAEAGLPDAAPGATARPLQPEPKSTRRGAAWREYFAKAACPGPFPTSASPCTRWGLPLGNDP